MRVQDDGDGITSEEAKEGFSHLGRSWKRYAGRSKTLKHVDYGLATTRCALRTQSHDVPDPPNHKWTAGLATEDLCVTTAGKKSEPPIGGGSLRLRVVRPLRCWAAVFEPVRPGYVEVLRSERRKLIHG
jgi:hypothetical protein